MHPILVKLKIRKYRQPNGAHQQKKNIFFSINIFILFIFGEPFGTFGNPKKGRDPQFENRFLSVLSVPAFFSPIFS